MSRMQVNMEIERLLGQVFEELGVPFLRKRQYSSVVDAMIFKRSSNRVYCYVLNKDRTQQKSRANLVFRFRSGDHPQNWFGSQEVDSLTSDWQKRMVRVWSTDTNTPAMFREPATVTDQFGLTVTAEDLDQPDVEKVLGRYVRIAIEAAIVAARHKNRDWSEYERLIA